MIAIMEAGDIVEILNEQLKGSQNLIISENSTPATIQVQKEDLLEVASFLHGDSRFYFDVLANLTAIDNGPEDGTMEIIYHLNSIPKSMQFGLKVVVERAKPEVDSLTSIWRAANWLEREAFDLVGVQFTGHPDLRRILLPNDWEGHPLRKDYSEQEYYHGIKVKY